MNKFTTFESLINTANKKCQNEKEKLRIREEEEYVKSRGWEQYLLLCTNLVGEIKHNMDFRYMETLKSMLDSYILHIVVFGSDINFFNSDKNKKIFFNDACRLTLSVHKTFLSETPIYQLDKIITDNLALANLKYREILRDAPNDFPCGQRNAKEDLIVVYKDTLSDEDFEIVKKFGLKEITEEDEQVILKYLVLRVQVFAGL